MTAARRTSGGVLLVDIGNTSVTLGLGTRTRVTRMRRVKARQCTAMSLLNAVAQVTEGRLLRGAVVCTVVPRLGRLCSNVIRKAFGTPPLMVSHHLDFGIRVDYPRPETIGADRLANAVAAVKLFGEPVIVADFGTAVTFDIVSSDRAYVGGVIAPGLPLMTDYLAERTAQLPHIELKGTHGPIGRSTAGAMRIGAKVGYRGIVHEIAEHILEQPGMAGAALCATGGYARWVLEGLSMPFHFEPGLTLRGLLEIFALNEDENG